MKKLFLLLTILAFIGCKETKIEISEVLTEKATVIALMYSPSEHHTDIEYTASDIGGVGMDYDGNLGLKVGNNMQITSTTIPEKYGVAFQCTHGTFTVDGSEPKYQILYEKLLGSTGDTVNILYQEQYLVTYKERENDTDPQEIESRVLIRLDFIDAQKQ